MGASGWRALGVAGLLVAVVAISAIAGRAAAATLETHPPIFIFGDAGFTAANGVRSGSGTEADPYIIADWNVTTDFDVAIEIANTHAYFVLETVEASAATTAISLQRVENGLLRGVAVRGGALGIHVQSSANVSVVESTVTGTRRTALQVWDSSSILLRGNTISSNNLDTASVDKGLLVDASSDVLADGNTILQNDIGVVVWGSSDVSLRANRIESNRVHGIECHQNSGLIISANQVSRNAGGGIVIRSTQGLALEDNEALDNGDIQITIKQSSGVVSGNGVSGRITGIEIVDSDDMRVEGNRVGGGYGMFVSGSDRMLLRYNNVSASLSGMRIAMSHDIVVASNEIWRTQNGFQFYDVGGTVAGNVVRVTSGILLNMEYKVFVVYLHNDFTRESGGGYGVTAYGGSAPVFTAGYPIGGNNWWAYQGTDACSGPAQDDCTSPDGIGDTAFLIPTPSGSFEDRYPLIAPIARANEAPTVDPVETLPVTAIAQESVGLSGLARDLDWDDIDYVWDFGDGTFASGYIGTPTVLGTAIHADHAYAAPGDYAVRLTVFDGAGGSASSGAVARIREPGLLRVFTSIDLHPDWGVPAKILVDGIGRDEWALNWLKMAPGEHRISYSDVPNLGTPSDTVVTVASGEVTEVHGEYLARGWLRVRTDSAVPGTITVNGVRRNDWQVWMAVPPGEYQIAFGPVAGYQRPPPETAAVVAERLTEVVGRYVRDDLSPGPDPSTFGLLRVATRVEGTASGVPTQILLDGVARDEWALNWVKLPAGTYTLSFTDVPNLETPAALTVTLAVGQTATVSAVFKPHGILRVVTEPAMPGTIFVNGSPFNDWQVWQSVLPGTYLVSFGPVPGYAAPAAVSVVVRANELSVVRGTYLP